MDLTDFIYRSNQCGTADELTGLFLQFLSQFGLDRFVFSEMSHDSTTQKESHHGILVNYPAEWMAHYVANHYIEHDPVYQAALTARRPFTWEMVEKRPDITHMGMRVMDEARECKLYNGVALSIHQPLGQVFGMGFAGSDTGIEYNRDILSLINAAANQFFIVYADLSGLDDYTQPDIYLTNREREVLLWISRGKNRTEISDILSVGESAVKRHTENIFTKLSVSTTGMAVAKALRMGLIQPF